MSGERWSTHSEIRKNLAADIIPGQGGPILYFHNSRHWKYTGEGHTIFVGSSGGGKSRRGTIPMTMSMIHAMESFICADPKGEIYTQTVHMLNPAYRKIVIDFRHLFESAACNILAPIAELYRSGNDEDMQVAMELLDHMSCALFPAVDKDPFWGESARSVFIGAACALMEYAGPEHINIVSVFQLITRGDERFGGPNNTYLKEFVGMMPADSTSAMELHSYITTAEETRGGIRSTFLQGLTPFIRSKGVTAMMSADDLHINLLDGETPTAIYIILPDETPIFDSICGILINELMTHYVRMAHDRYDGRLPRRLNVILEEFGNIGHAIPNLPHLMSAGRSRNIRCQLVLQSFSQLNAIYGSAKATTIRENASVLVAYRSNHWDTLSELSRMCGEREICTNGNLIRNKLITPSNLSAMQVGQALVTISGGTKFITWLPDFTEMFDCRNMETPPRLPRVVRKPPEIFDIQAFVKDFKKRKMDMMLNGHTDVQQLNPVPFTSRAASAHEDSSDPVQISDLVARIDARIASLEAEERRSKSNNASKTMPYIVTLISCSARPHSVIRSLRTMLGFGLKEATDITQNLPWKKYFSAIEEARAFALALTSVDAVIQTEGF